MRKPELQKKDVLVLIPAYNEQKNIESVIQKVRALGFPVLVSDDGSKDATVEIAKRAGAEVSTSEANQGKGVVIQRGISLFLDSPYKAIVLMDADGQHDPNDLEVFFEALKEGRGELFLGNRMAYPKGMPFIRFMTNLLMSWFLSALAFRRVPDSQCGYRAAFKHVFQKIRLRSRRYEIESEMILEAAAHKIKMISIPVRCVYEGQTSQINPLKDTLRFFKFIFEYYFGGGR